MPRFQVTGNYRWEAWDIDANPLGHDEEGKQSLRGYYRNEKAAEKALAASTPWPIRAQLIPGTIRVTRIEDSRS